MESGYLKHLADGPERYRKFLAVDCSEPVLRKLVQNKFGRLNDFNRDQAYVYLKNHCGINATWFDPAEYEKRMDVICKVTGV